MPLRRHAEALFVGVLCVVACVICGRYAVDARTSPDANETLGIVRNLESGRGLLLDVEFQLFTPCPPPLPAVGERPLLYPLALAVASQCGMNALWFGMLVNALTALLLFLLVRHASGRPAAWCALLVLLAWATWWKNGVHAWPDNLYLLLLLGVFWLLRGEDTAPTLGAGCLLGLASLTRPEGVWIALAVIALHGRGRRQPTLELSLGLVVTMAPYWIVNGLQHGNPFYASHTNHLRVKSLYDAYVQDYRHDWPSPWTFVSTHFDWVARHFLEVEWLGVTSLLKALGALALGLVFAALPAARPLPAVVRLSLGAGVADMILANGAWASTTLGDPKTCVVPSVLLMPVLWHGLWHGVRSPRFTRGLALLTLCLALRQQVLAWPPTVYGWGWSFTDVRRAWDDKPEVRWLKTLPPDTILAATSPWDPSYASRRAGVIMPLNADPQALAEFIYDCGVDVVLDEPTQPVDFLQPVPGLDAWRVRRARVLRMIAHPASAPLRP